MGASDEFYHVSGARLIKFELYLTKWSYLLLRFRFTILSFFIDNLGLGVVMSDIPGLAYHLPTRLRFNNIDHSHATYVQESAIGGVMHVDLVVRQTIGATGQI